MQHLYSLAKMQSIKEPLNSLPIHSSFESGASTKMLSSVLLQYIHQSSNTQQTKHIHITVLNETKILTMNNIPVMMRNWGTNFNE